MGKVETQSPIVMDTQPKDDSLPEYDPELEEETRAWAELLLEIYLAKLEEERKEKDKEGPVT